MNRIAVSIFLWTAMIVAVTAAGTEKNSIVVTSSPKNQRIQKVKRTLLKKFPRWNTTVEKIGDRYILKAGPYADSKAMTLAYLKLRKYFPQAFIWQPEKEENQIQPKLKIVKKTVYVDKPVYIEKEDQTLWIALFGLGIVGIFALFLSSEQIRKMKKKYAQMLKRQDEIEEKQSFLVEKMGEQIQDVTIKNIEEEQKLLDINLNYADPKEIKTHIENLKEKDEELLETTYEMLDFLKIKSGNVVIKKEPFQLGNMLHKLTNFVFPLLRIETRSLYYDIDNDVPRYIVGDGTRIHQVLCNLVAHSLESGLESKVEVKIEVSKEKEIHFTIINRQQYMTKEEIEGLFIPSSWEELQDRDLKYSFFVTKELISRMEGDLTIDSGERQGTIYQLKLPYIEDKYSQSKRTNLQNVLKGKKVLLVDKSMREARVLHRILKAFNLEVEFMSSDNFHHMKPDIDHIEMIFMRPKDINPHNFHFFKKLRESRLPRIILAHDIVGEEELVYIASEVADAELHKPIIIGDVEEMLIQLYLREEEAPELIPNEGELQTFRIQSAVDVPKHIFGEFVGRSVLVVEDNEVNRKVLTNILEAAEIRVYQAENGRQALNLLTKGTPVDLILMDMSMPVMDGFEATKRIKDEPLFKDIPVIAVTGLGFYHEMERMRFVGADACIVKPFKLGELYEGLRKYLDTHVPMRCIPQTTPHRYKPPVNILDIKRGIKNVHNESFYTEILQDVKATLENSDQYFADLVSGGRIEELQAFCRDSLSLVDTVGAYQLAKIFKETLVFISIGEKDSLAEYTPLYESEWRLLDKEITLYLGDA